MWRSNMLPHAICMGNDVPKDAEIEVRSKMHHLNVTPDGQAILHRSQRLLLGWLLQFPSSLSSLHSASACDVWQPVQHEPFWQHKWVIDFS